MSCLPIASDTNCALLSWPGYTVDYRCAHISAPEAKTLTAEETDAAAYHGELAWCLCVYSKDS